MFRRRQCYLIHLIGICIRTDLSIPQIDDSCGIKFRQFRVMGNHHNQTVFRHLPQQIHNLYTGITVQCSGRLIRKQNLRIIDQCSGDCHSLHLSARQLAWSFFNLFSQTYFFQGFFRSSSSLRFSHAGDGQRQLNIGKQCLMRNQIITLENKSDRMISVGIPVPVFVFFRGNPVDDQIPAVVTIQPADNI